MLICCTSQEYWPPTDQFKSESSWIPWMMLIWYRRWRNIVNHHIHHFIKYLPHKYWQNSWRKFVEKLLMLQFKIWKNVFPNSKQRNLLRLFLVMIIFQDIPNHYNIIGIENPESFCEYPHILKSLYTKYKNICHRLA